MTKRPAKQEALPKVPAEVLAQERGMRVKKLLADNKWTQAKLSEETGIHAVSLSKKLNGKLTITETDANLIAPLFNVRPGWIMGTEKYPTQGEEFAAVLNEVTTESELLFTGLAAFAKVTGFDLIPPQLRKGQTAEAAISEVKRGYQLKKGDKSVNLTLEQFNRLENKIADIINIELSYLLKED